MINASICVPSYAVIKPLLALLFSPPYVLTKWLLWLDGDLIFNLAVLVLGIGKVVFAEAFLAKIMKFCSVLSDERTGYFLS